MTPDGEQLFAGDAQRLAAGDHHVQVRRVGEQIRHAHGRLSDVLEGVQDEQQPLAAQIGADGFGDGQVRPFNDAE